MISRARRLRLLGLAGMALGLLLLALAGFYVVAVALEESRLPALEVRGDTSPTADTPLLSEEYRPPTPTAAFAEGMRLVIPALELDEPIIHTSQEIKDGQLTWESPAFAVGHLEGTALPGQPGNAVLAGHILTLTEGSVFRRLPEIASLLEQGQAVAIWAITPEGRFLYWARETRVVEPQDVSVTAPTSEPALTLITCVPSWNPTHRFVVIAQAASLAGQ